MNKYMCIINRRVQTGAIKENMPSNIGDTIRNGYRTQTGAIFESMLSNAGDAIWNRHRGQIGAITESVIGNRFNAIGNGIVSAIKTRHMGKYSFTINRSFRNWATTESIVSNVDEAIRNVYGSQIGTIFESSKIDTSDAIWEFNRGQTGATLESKPSNIGDAIGNFYGC